MAENLLKTVVSICLGIVLIGCQDPQVVAPPSPSPPAAPTPTATQELSVTTRIEMYGFDELEQYLKELSVSQDPTVLGVYGDVHTDFYYRLDNPTEDAYIRNITLNSALSFVYQFDEEEDIHWENKIIFTWYWNYPDEKLFFENLCRQERDYEEIIGDDGQIYIYAKGMIPPSSAYPQGKEISQYVHWTQGDECFTCSFPLRFSKEEVLELCKAVKVNID